MVQGADMNNSLNFNMAHFVLYKPTIATSMLPQYKNATLRRVLFAKELIFTHKSDIDNY